MAQRGLQGNQVTTFPQKAGGTRTPFTVSQMAFFRGVI
jgi:hypothetical protein